MKKILNLIKEKMKEIGLDYHFQENRNSKIIYPYFVGELVPIEGQAEDGMQEYSFILSGFDRTESYMRLFECAGKVEQEFPMTGYAILNGNQCIAIWANKPKVIQTGNAELKKIEQNLMVKTWKGCNYGII